MAYYCRSCARKLGLLENVYTSDPLQSEYQWGKFLKHTVAGVLPDYNPLARRSFITANAMSNSSTLRTPTGTRRTPSFGAASSKPFNQCALIGDVALKRTAIGVRLGRASFSNSRILLPNSGPVMMVNPVMLPPGRARLLTSPTPTGSSPTAIIMGIVVVVCSTAMAALLTLTMNRSTL